jgi:PTS system mannose-specific IIA component/PTS system mannose-specific IIB component
MDEQRMVTGIIVTHGSLAEELIETAKRIFGGFSDCYAVTNEGKSPHVLFEEMKLLVDALEGAPCMVFVDFVGGSCCHACMRLKIDRDDIPILSGINLPMLLAFLNKRDAVPFEQLPDEILNRGRNSIQAVDPSKV